MMTVTDPDAATLNRLKTEYGRRWLIRRTPRLWIAVAIDPLVEPTLIEDTPEGLEERMRNPDSRIGGPLIPEPR